MKLKISVKEETETGVLYQFDLTDENEIEHKAFCHVEDADPTQSELINIAHLRFTKFHATQLSIEEFREKLKGNVIGPK